jgi:neopullulanase
MLANALSLSVFTQIALASGVSSVAFHATRSEPQPPASISIVTIRKKLHSQILSFVFLANRCTRKALVLILLQKTGGGTPFLPASLRSVALSHLCSMAYRFRAGARWVLPLLLAILALSNSALCAQVVPSLTPGGPGAHEPTASEPATSDSADGPLVSKVEPPNWWLNLTPELMVLLSGRNLDATKVECNLSGVHVMRTQSSAAGAYLFVWLKIDSDTRTGTAVCRITAPSGEGKFELPIAPRQPTLGRFQGLAPSDVLYLIMPDRFANGDPTNDEPSGSSGTHDRTKPRTYHGGDLRGVRDHLGYLHDLGVTTLWLTPVVKNGAPQDYHGYGTVDLYAVDSHLGSLADYDDLVAAAHQQHMKIFFDAVPNHVGPHHPWVDNPPLPDWFHGTKARHLDTVTPVHGSFYGAPEKQNNDLFEALVDPHAPASLRKNLTEGWFAGMLPDMNTENPIVAEYLLENTIWWIESSGLDGLRLDTFPYVSRKFWSEWHAGLRRIYPNLTTIGEVFHPDPSVTSFFVGGQRRWDGIDSGLTTVFDYPMYFAIREILLRGAPAGGIANILRHDSLYFRPNLLVPFFANHDVPRFASQEGASIAKLKLAFGLTLTLRGIPELYYGDEIGMPGGPDPDNRRDFPGGWKDDTRNAFTAEGRTPEQQDLFAFVQSLLHLRRDHEALQSGKLWHLASDANSYVFLRESEEEKLLIAFHKDVQPRELTIPTADTPAQRTTALESLFGSAKGTVHGGQIKLNLPPESISIFSLQ